MTIVEKGDHLQITVNYAGETVVLLYTKGNQGIKEQYPGKFNWLYYCPLFKYARLYQKTELIQLFVTLLEKTNLHCDSLGAGVAVHRIQVPFDYHCSSCSNMVMRSKSVQQKQA